MPTPTVAPRGVTGAFRSTDNGRTWKKLEDESPSEIVQDPKDTGRLYGIFNYTHIRTSTDAVRTWADCTDGLELVKPGERPSGNHPAPTTRWRRGRILCSRQPAWASSIVLPFAGARRALDDHVVAVGDGARVGVIRPQLLLGRRLVVVREVAKEEERERRTAEFLTALLGQPCSASLTVKIQNQVTAAVRPSCEALAAQLPAQEQLSIDETGTKQEDGKAWLWACAPDLNPVEWMWKHLNTVEMRNLACLDLEELHVEFHLALGRLRQKPRLIPSFFAGAKLKL